MHDDDDDDYDDGGDYVISHVIIISCFDWQIVDLANNKCNQSSGVVMMLEGLHICQVEQFKCRL